MRIYSISDIHTEFYTVDNLPKITVSADVLVLAGDVGRCDTEQHTNLLVAFLTSCNHQHIIYIPGNHEFYGWQPNQYDEVIEKLHTICKPLSNVHFLHKDYVTINEYTFIGTTLWSAIDHDATKQISDFRYVFTDKVDYLEKFVSHYVWLRKLLKSFQDKKCPTIVVTHHLPSIKLIHNRFQLHEYKSLNTAFYTNIVDKLELHFTKYWFCGHTHEYATFTYGDCKIIVNPVGYPNEKRYTSISSSVYDL